MSGFLVVAVSRRRFALVRSLCSIAMTGLALVGCSGSAASDEQALIGVETSQFSVVIENKIGMPLTDVQVAILPVGGVTQFTKMAGRLDNGEKREIGLAGFFGRDGTPFSLRVVRPKTVRVTGKDLNNKPHQVDVPWK
jgi:hypothetical protein